MDVRTPQNIATAREALHRGEMSCELVASEGSRFRLRDLGTLCTGLDRLLAAVGKETGATGIEWCVTGLGLTTDRLRVTFGAYPKPKRRRSSKAMSA
jgi:hypothetical protein